MRFDGPNAGATGAESPAFTPPPSQQQQINVLVPWLLGGSPYVYPVHVSEEVIRPRDDPGSRGTPLITRIHSGPRMAAYLRGALTSGWKRSGRRLGLPTPGSAETQGARWRHGGLVLPEAPQMHPSKAVSLGKFLSASSLAKGE